MEKFQTIQLIVLNQFDDIEKYSKFLLEKGLELWTYQERRIANGPPEYTGKPHREASPLMDGSQTVPDAGPPGLEVRLSSFSQLANIQQ
ncbi:hypothetical protein M0802_000178 [Mischocyttarus mexicanus]|nr:hypothetical protein M0802_000178 [Mischocyttarus mexicanus]